uniref:Uncharacterized protein n=1 Tax=Accipiter nisus TaxID=211598 RepID=A0A8B9MQR3_9AVES
MMTRGAGTAFSRKGYRLSLGPEKSKLPGMGLHRLYGFSSSQINPFLGTSDTC